VDSELTDVARALIDARTDHANHTTAAAARTASGRIITGVNVFHFTGGPCAELVVIGSAAAAGAGEQTEIVAVGDGGRGILSPCGRCRQVLADYFPKIRVIISTGHEPRSVPISELLPWGNRWDPQLGSIPVAPPET
jgi:cytidine deaminase